MTDVRRLLAMGTLTVAFSVCAAFCFNTQHSGTCGTQSSGGSLECGGPAWVITAPEIRTCNFSLGEGRVECDDSGGSVTQQLITFTCENGAPVVASTTPFGQGCLTAKLDGRQCEDPS